MRVLILTLAIVALVKAGNYKGQQVVKVGRKTYKCTLNINYDVSPPKCGKATAKCKPNPKKPIKVTIDTDDATLAFSVQKNKVKGCKVEPTTAASTAAPGGGGGGGTGGGTGGGGGGAGTGGGGSEVPGEHMNCNCKMPFATQAPAVRSLGTSLTKMLVKTNPSTGLSKARIIPEAVERGGGEEARMIPEAVERGGGEEARIIPEAVERGGGEEARMIPQAVERGGGHGHYHPRPPQYTATTPQFTDLLPLLVLAIVAGIIGALKGELIANLLGLRSLEPQPKEEVAEKERMQANILAKLLDEKEQARIIKTLEDRQGLLGGLLGNNGGGGAGNGAILGNLLGGGGGNNGGGGNGNDLGGLLGGLLGGAAGNEGGGNGNDLGGLLGGLLGGAAGNNGGGNGGDLGSVLTQAILQNMIDQIISNPESLQEMITIAVQSGMAEQLVNNLVESGDIEALVQNLVESGAGPDIIANLGNGLVQNMVNNNEMENIGQNITGILEGALNGMAPGSLESVLEGVDVQNMELNMQCSCVREDTLLFPVPGK